tara:strand:+ start:2367 stop:3455 length:1089 start_codon:yes stop_codon:yes gene_type:complete
MKNFNKLILLIFLLFNTNVNTAEIEKVLFTIDSNTFTSIDLNNRKKYIDLIRDKDFFEKENDFYLEDLISVMLFDIEFNKTEVSNKKVDELVNDYYNNIKFNKINEILDIEKIKENIRYDFQRKIILEKLLDTQKDIVFEQNKDELTEIYKINLEYFSFNQNNNELLLQLLDKSNFKNINDNIKLLKENNIEYLFSNKEINFNNVLNENIKSEIKNNKKEFNFKLNNDTYIYGKISKKLKIDKELKFTLIQIIKKNDNKKIDAKCDKINELIKNNNFDIKILENIDYYKLNETIKNNLYSLNDKIIIKNENQENHIILCDIKYNKEEITKINIDNRVNYLVEKIAQEFISQKKIIYKFINYE